MFVLTFCLCVPLHVCYKTLFVYPWPPNLYVFVWSLWLYVTNSVFVWRLFHRSPPVCFFEPFIFTSPLPTWVLAWSLYLCVTSHQLGFCLKILLMHSYPTLNSWVSLKTLFVVPPPGVRTLISIFSITFFPIYESPSIHKCSLIIKHDKIEHIFTFLTFWTSAQWGILVDKVARILPRSLELSGKVLNKNHTLLTQF